MALRAPPPVAMATIFARGWRLIHCFLALRIWAIFLLVLLLPISANVANHRRQKTERRRSGAFWRPSEFALLGNGSLVPCIDTFIPGRSFPITNNPSISTFQTFPANLIIFGINPYFNFSRAGFSHYYFSTIDCWKCYWSFILCCCGFYDSS